MLEDLLTINIQIYIINYDFVDSTQYTTHYTCTLNLKFLHPKITPHAYLYIQTPTSTIH